MRWDGDDYHRRVTEQARAAGDPHGEADFVMALLRSLGAFPGAVLDAGCGTGRVAAELDRRGVGVTGVDLSASMLAVARRETPHVEWIESDLTQLDLGRTFDVVVLAGNVLLFTAPGTQDALVAGCARHVRPGGLLVAGFEIGRNYPLSDYDRACDAAGLTGAERYATWDAEPFTDAATYAVSVHRR